MEISSTQLVVLINGYDGNKQQVKANAKLIQELPRKYYKSDGRTYFIY